MISRAGMGLVALGTFMVLVPLFILDAIGGEWFGSTLCGVLGIGIVMVIAGFGIMVLRPERM